MEQICVGIILKAFGIKGEVKVKSMTDFVKQRFKIGKTIEARKENQTKSLLIQSIREHQGALLIKFKDIDTMNDAELLRDYELFVDRESVHRLAKNEYYFFDLKDCDVYLKEGQYVGKVIRVEDFPAQAVLRIKTEGKDALVPFISQFIVDVDIREKKIVIDPIEGLIE